MKSCLVVGLGRFGYAVARELCEMGVEVLGIDENDDVVSRSAAHITHAVAGDAKDEAVLHAIGARNFDCAVVAMAGDVESSVMVTILLKELGVKQIIAKASGEMHAKILRKVGADTTIFPEDDMGKRLAQKLASSNVLDFIELSDEYSIVEIGTPAAWSGRTIKQLDVRAKYGINILAIRDRTDRENINISPSANYVLNEGDVLVIVGSNEEIDKIK